MSTVDNFCAVSCIVRGMVQGVFFRRWTWQRARALGLGGWVLNRTDGGVEVFIQGQQEKVGQFLAELKRGPRGARVETIESDWSVSIHQDIREFEIRC